MGARLEVLGARLALALARRLPDGLTARLGRACGRLAYRFGVRRHVTRGNLALAFGTNPGGIDLHQVERRAYEHVGQCLFEFLSLPRQDAARLRSQVEIEGIEHLRAARDQGRGVILAAGHIGNWEVCGAGFAAQGFPVTFVVQPMRNAAVDALVQSVRRGAGIEVLERGMALRRVRAALEANRLVFIMCDQDARRRGVFVPFFGVPASSPKGAAQMAIRFGVPFLTAFCDRRTDGRDHTVVGPPIAPPEGVTEDEAVVSMLQRYNERLEAAIRRHPEQYWWAHRRWKTRPPASVAAPPILTASGPL